MPNKIYSVKQAAKILGLSTNTTYKYLKEGRIRASRGNGRGTFLIPSRSIEAFLGQKIADDATVSSTSHPTPPRPSPNTFAISVIRTLISLCLIIIIADIILSQNFSPLTQLIRLSVIIILLLISYQFGGFSKNGSTQK